MESHESRAEAENRSFEEKQKITDGKLKEKNHGNIQNYNWQWKECLEYFRNLERGSLVVYKDAARKFKLINEKGIPKNGGQLLRKFLIKNNVNLDHFKTIRGDAKWAPRKALKRLV